MTKSAILIDGGYLLKRLPTVRPDVDSTDPGAVARSIWQLVKSHLEKLNEIDQAPNPVQLLYRTFYYDAPPYTNKQHRPISGAAIDYARTVQAQFREQLFDRLRSSRSVAVRLGEIRREPGRSWNLNSGAQKRLLDGSLALADLTDDDFSPAIRQKGVDMRIGLDIATLTLKKHVDTIVLVSGDADFVPAAKLARREGIRFVLDPLWNHIPSDLNEHIDGLTSGFRKPQRITKPTKNSSLVPARRDKQATYSKCPLETGSPQRPCRGVDTV